jgi:hypothetical protein
MSIASRKRLVVVYLAALVLVVCANLFLTSLTEGQPTADVVQENCPGVPAEGQVTTTGQSYGSRSVPEITINGAPWGGGYWAAGTRTYWHCHPGGQLLVIWDGEGRVQTRGQRARTLYPGESMFSRPWEEHWHGASAHADAHYLQVNVAPKGTTFAGGTLWMEEVSESDYLGNDIGINSRNNFLGTTRGPAGQ